MKRLIFISLLSVFTGLSVFGQENPENSFLRQLSKRDSVLIGDQLKYGFRLNDVENGTVLALPDYSAGIRDSVELVSDWNIDTLKSRKTSCDIECSVVVTAFDEGEYQLPAITVARSLPDGSEDSLFFNPQLMQVKTMPVDTANFVAHDIKGQAVYPVTFKELLPYFGAVALLIALGFLIAYLIRKYKEKMGLTAIAGEAPHIIALRKLDRLRGSKYWAPEKQKAFYSGVTDALREYISARYEVGAMEMTSAELFVAIKDKEMPQDLREGLKELFEQSDFVKFAKLTLPDEDNAKVIPFSVRFVSETYQEILEEEEKKDVL